MKRPRSTWLVVLFFGLAGCGAAANQGIGPILAHEPASLGAPRTARAPATEGAPEPSSSDFVETDSDLPYEESLGLKDTPFTGPSSNGLIGLDSRVSAWSLFALDGRRALLRDAPSGDRAIESIPTLSWLATQQHADGGWDEGGHGTDARSDDPGLTGHVLLTYLAGRYTNRGRHPYAKTVARGLRYLKQHQGPDGWFGPTPREGDPWPRDLAHHGPALAAMVEAYAQTHSPIFLSSARKGLAALADACENERWELRDPATSYACLLALLSATWTNRAFAETDVAFERSPRAPRFDVTRERFPTLARQRYTGRSASAEDVAIAVLARRVFDDPADVEAAADLEALALELRAAPTAWATDLADGGPRNWALVHAAIELTPKSGSARGQLAARSTLFAHLEAHDLGGEPRFWNPRTLPGHRDGPVRLTALALASLWSLRATR